MRGSKKPITLHILEGTGRKARLEKRKDEAVLAPGPIGDPPPYFDAEMKTEWARVTRDLALYLAPAHRSTVEHHCVLYKRFVEDAKGGERMSASERNAFHSIQMQLGATPASMSKVLAPKVEKPDDPWEKLA